MQKPLKEPIDPAKHHLLEAENQKLKERKIELENKITKLENKTTELDNKVTTKTQLEDKSVGAADMKAIAMNNERAGSLQETLFTLSQ